MSRFGIQQTKVNGTLYAGMAGYQLDRGVEVQSEGSDGTLNETAHHVVRRRPMADLTSLSLKTMIGILNGGTDLPVLALDGTNGMVMYGAKQASNAVGYSASSVHVSRTGLRGLLYMSGVRWSAGGKAEMLLRAMFISPDGTTQGVTDSAVAALPTQPTPDLGFTLTAASAGGDTLTAVNSLEISIEPRFEFDYSTGLPEPVSIYGAGANGRLAITARIETGDINLGAAASGACAFTFTQFANGGGFGSNTVTFTLNSAWSNEENLQGSNGQPMGRGLLARTYYNGSTKPLTWSTT